jgi:hypothetical protein
MPLDECERLAASRIADAGCREIGAETRERLGGLARGAFIPADARQIGGFSLIGAAGLADRTAGTLVLPHTEAAVLLSSRRKPSKPSAVAATVTTKNTTIADRSPGETPKSPYVSMIAT